MAPKASAYEWDLLLILISGQPKQVTRPASLESLGKENVILLHKGKMTTWKG